jgi:gamma-glutamyltranspeptidase / glutathione hydrolase
MPRGPRHARRLAFGWLSLVSVLGAGGCADPPELGPLEAEATIATRHMVSAANPIAAKVGLAVLRSGGNAVDAAVAVQAALTFVEPSESGIGGGGFMVHFDAVSRTLTVYDGREQAPRAASPERFQLLGWPVPRWVAVPTGRSVGVPGTLRMLEQAHAAHGVKPWGELFAPAIELAERGIPMPPRLQQQVASDHSLRLFRDTRHAFVRPARAREPTLRSPDLARTLATIAEHGADAFHAGPIAESIVEAARGRWPWPSDMTVEDLAGYRALAREPLCGGYRGWMLCGPPPPSSGTLAVLQILGMIERFDLAALEPASVEAIHIIAEATRLALADRFHYVGDPAFVAVPAAALIGPGYLARRGRLIEPARAMGRALPGEPGGRVVIEDVPPAEEHDHGGTSHFTIVDAQGNAVSLTGSIEAPFGSRIMAAGFLLNNQLTDFAFRPVIDAFEVPNAVAGGKRPTSSMAPLVVLGGSGELRLLVGSRGGARIIGHVVKTLVAVLDWELTLQEAIAMPNFLQAGERLELERGTPLEAHADALRRLGHEVAIVRLVSGTNGIERRAEHWSGGADPRIGAFAAGD